MSLPGKTLESRRFSPGKRPDPRSDLAPSPESAKPFVKWVGGKTQLLDAIAQTLPPDFALRGKVTYVEPFVGGGAVLFWMLRRFPNVAHAVINDVNADLIAAYRAIQRCPGALVDSLRRIENAYLPLDEDRRRAFYLAERTKFNSPGLDEVARAALLVFLNRTCFNGLFRVNRGGKFNVPFGRYASPTICDERTILADSLLLQKVTILNGDFAATADHAPPGALFYFDPPYKPLGQTASFNSYSRHEFDDAEQKRLAAFCRRLDAAGHPFILSNSDLKGKDPSDDFFDDLYKGFAIRRVFASRMVNANAAKRGKLTELMVTNIGAGPSNPEGGHHE